MQVTKIGTSQKQFDDAKGESFAEIGSLKDGIAQHRVIAGPVLVETIWYPTIVEKEGAIVQSARTIIRPKEGCILDTLAKFEEEKTREWMRSQGAESEDIKKFRSSLRPNRKFRFLVFDREADNNGTPTVRVFDYPFTVKDQIETLQKTVNKKDPAHLEYGLAFMFDVYIERTQDKDKSVEYGTKYSVRTVTDTLPTVKGVKIPVEALKMSMAEIAENVEFSAFFTEEELTAIEAFDKDLEVLSKQDTEETIQEKLVKNPIALDALFVYGKKQNTPMFPIFKDQELREKIIAEFGELLAEGEVKELPPAKTEQPATSRASLKVALGKEQIQDAKVEDIKETPKVEAKAPIKPSIKPFAKPVAPTVSAPVTKVEETKDTVEKPSAPAPRKVWGAKK